MRQTALIILLLFVSNKSNSQCILSNGGFERFPSSCSPVFDSDSQFQLYNWYNPFDSYRLGITSTPDCFNECYNSLFPGLCGSYICVPYNQLGYQETHTGKGYAGILTYMPPDSTQSQQVYREYIEVKLDTSLISGRCYHFKMYCSFPDSSYFASPTIGAFFSDTLVQGSIIKPFDAYLWLPAQIENQASNWNSDNWFSVEGDYLAHGGERYITVGNFHPDSQTVRYPFHTNVYTTGKKWSYIYIDDVSLIPCEEDTIHSKRYSLCYGDSITLKLDSLAPMPTSPCKSGLNYCHWYDKRHTPLHNGFSYTIKPTRDTVLYTIRGNDTCSCGYYQDSFAIHVIQPLGKEKNRYDTLCAGETKQLIADTLQATYQWYNYSNVLVANTKAYSVNPVNSTKYYLILQDTLQLCVSRTDTFNVQVLDPPCAKIAIPTAFSPNGDGNNDVFAPIFYQSTSSEMQMRVYNRWGEIIYNGNSAWDGKYKGVLQPNDTYFYVVDINGEYFKGNVELMR